jgi:hypothetical protein
MPPPDNAKPARNAQDSSSSEVVLQECEALEAALAALRSSYEQYFLGIDRQAPTRAHDDLKKRMLKLKSAFIRSTAAKFRVQSIHSKYLTYERLWARTLQEIEAGTYRRDLFKARRRAGSAPEASAAGAEKRKDVVELPEEIDDLDFEEVEQLARRVSPNEPKLAAAATPAVAPVTGGTPFRGVPAVTPAVPAVASAGTPARGLPTVTPGVTPVGAARPSTVPPGMAAKAPGATPTPRPPVAGGSSGLSDDKLRAVYDAYVTAKRRCQEDTSKLSYESVAATLRKQVPELLKQHNAKAVEFKVVIKDGKASLKAVPK